MKISKQSNTILVTFLLLICTVLFMYPVELYSQDQPDTHTVRSGDTLFSISRQYDITVAEIREWNDLEDDALRIGMEIRIASPQQYEALTHTVSPQETLFSVSRQYGVTIAEIQQWNNLENTALSIGQELIIYSDQGNRASGQPDQGAQASSQSERQSIVSPTTISANTYYTVQSGDYLNRIAQEHGMTTDELRQLNNLGDDLIRVGQRLVVRETQNTPVVDDNTEDSTPQGRFVNYRLESGENTDTILERFSMTLDELKTLNPGTDVESLLSGQRITVLLPPSRNFQNPYRQSAGLRDLGDVAVSRYNSDDAASTTTSGELYSPDQLTAAHSNMALGSIVFVENPGNGKGVYVKINDRFSGDGIKLSDRAYTALDFVSASQATASIYQED